MSSMFYKKFTNGMVHALHSFYDDNFDRELVPLSRLMKVQLFGAKLVGFFSRFLGGGGSATIYLASKNNYFFENIEKFEPFYEGLCDEDSKDRLVELLAFRALGPTKVKLSLNTSEYWQGRKSIEKYKQNDSLEVKNFRCHLSLFDLKAIGYDLKLYFASNGVYVDFVLQQYNYNDQVCVNDGDVVIDAGACWGDTALYFASRGAKAVYSFEFIPSNLTVFEKNMALNPSLKDCIRIVKNPVWSESKVALSYDDRGPASQVGAKGEYGGDTQTLSIDDLVVQQDLKSVDFIKMDIEGAEMPALKGAKETIKRFKPKLAISVYHKPDDMIVIPKYILSLNPNYKFYLDYYTIVGHEIMLYAIDDEK